MSCLDKLIELAEQLPHGLRSDWDGSNHWELTSCGKNYWWFGLMDVARPHNEEYFDCDNPEHRKIGLLFDIAQEVRRLYDTGSLKRIAGRKAVKRGKS